MAGKFTCPKVLEPYWNIKECTVQKCTDGSYIILDHSIQSVIYEGTREECETFFKNPGGNLIDEEDF